MSARFWVVAGLLAAAVPVDAQAQAPPTDQTPAVETQRTEGRDVVGTSTVGDVGLWFVPLADTNGRGRWRGSVMRTSRNTVQGISNVADFTASVSYGLWSRADVFFSWDAVARVDRDTNPLFNPSDSVRGGVDPAAPFMRTTWSSNQRGDMRVGAKIKVFDEYEHSPLSFSVRAIGRLPSGDSKDGAGMGAPSFDTDLIASRWVAQRLVVTGSVGGSQRANPKDPVTARIPPIFDWGAGLGFLPMQQILLHAEYMGEKPLKRETTNLDQQLVGADGSVSPLLNIVDHHKAIATGLTWMSRSGFFLGAAAKFDFPMKALPQGSRTLDYTDIQVRLGWRPAPRRGTFVSEAAPAPYTPTAPETPPPAPAPPAETPAPAAEAPAPAPPAEAASPRREFVFEDVYFDFDRYSLRPEALRILDEAVNSMKESKTVRMVIEGHTCNIGTTEYNLALGERRAHAVYEYLTGHGVQASRLSYVSFGEERPKYDNSREETRRLNRRAAMVVRLETTNNDQR